MKKQTFQLDKYCGHEHFNIYWHSKYMNFHGARYSGGKIMYALDTSTNRENEMADFILIYYMSGILALKLQGFSNNNSDGLCASTNKVLTTAFASQKGCEVARLKDSETVFPKIRDSEIHRIAQNMRLRDAYSSGEILRDPNFW